MKKNLGYEPFNKYIQVKHNCSETIFSKKEHKRCENALLCSLQFKTSIFNFFLKTFTLI